MANKKKWLTAGIDVGTTKICSAVAQIEDGKIHILGTGVTPSRGLKKGIVINLSEAIESIRASLDQAESESQTVIESAYVSIGGPHVRSQNANGTAEVQGKNGEIAPDDVARAVVQAQSDVPANSQIIHVLTQDFNVDGQEGFSNPLGIRGRQLTVHLHLVYNASAVVQNIVNAVNKSGVLVEGVVLQQLASAESILSQDEKELGSIVVDIGGGTTDIAAYHQGSIWHSEVLPLGGNLITKDIAIGLKAPLQDAELLKKEFGSVFPESVPAEELVEVAEVGTGRRRTMNRRLLCQIVQARCDEILNAITIVVRRLRLPSDLITGVVMTGGGSLLDGLVDRAEHVLRMPVRVGYPVNVVSGNDAAFHPSYSTGLGLIKYARDMQDEAVARAAKAGLGNRPKGTTGRMKNWIFDRIS
jgi:cell division protein FtsA